VENYKTLKTRWYKKLKKEGFNDIENNDGSLKAEVDPRTISYALSNKESREEYYKKAEEFLANHKGFIEQERQIWALHCQGMGAVRISKLLKITLYRADSTLANLRKLSGLARKK